MSPSRRSVYQVLELPLAFLLDLRLLAVASGSSRCGMRRRTRGNQGPAPEGAAISMSSWTRYDRFASPVVYLFFLLESNRCFYVACPCSCSKTPPAIEHRCYGQYIASLISFYLRRGCSPNFRSIPSGMSMTAPSCCCGSRALQLHQPSVLSTLVSGLPFAVGTGIIYCPAAPITEWTEPF